MAITNPSLEDGFDTNGSNVLALSTPLKDDGYATSEIPKSGHINTMFKDLYRYMQFLKQTGISQWDNTTSYPEFSRIMRNGVVYKSLSDANQGNDPLSSLDVFWSFENKGALATENFMHLQDVKTLGTAVPFESGSWLIRILNTVTTNNILGSSLSASVVTLPKGIYYIDAVAPIVGVGNAKLRLFNVTTGLELVKLDGANAYGENSFSGTTNPTQVYSKLTALVEILAITEIKLEHKCITTNNTNGGGIASSLGDFETYAQVKIWKVG